MKCYYQVNNRVYTNSILAMIESFSSKEPINFKLSDKYNNYDYKIPENKTISELEEEHAKNIFNRNNLCRIVYSGGSDSYSVAHAFVRSGIKCKYTLYAYKTLKDNIFDSYSQIDYKIDKLNKLHQEYNLDLPEIEIIKINEDIIREVYNDEKYFLKGTFFNGNKEFNASLICDNLKYSKWDPFKYTNIFGLEKPRLSFDNKGLYWYARDDITMYCLSNNYNSEWFYLSDNFPKIINAQCWNMIKYILKRKYSYNNLIHEVIDLENDKKRYLEWCLALGRKVDFKTVFLNVYSKVSCQLKEITSYRHLEEYKNNNDYNYNNYNKMINCINDLNFNISNFTNKSDKYYLILKKI